MNRIEKNFKGRKNLVGYITAGYPNIETTENIIYKMVDGGVDLLEIGIPFSDPNAEGEILHNANLKSLENGMRLEKAFDLVKDIRKKIDIPIIYYTYCNPVFAYGYENFFEKCKEIGVDGLFIPDLPFEEIDEMSDYANRNNVDLITIIFSFSSKERIEKLVKKAKGFIYFVPILGEDENTEAIKEVIEFIKDNTNIPIIIDAGIENENMARIMSGEADGIKIGAPIVNLVNEFIKEPSDNIYNYISKIKNSLI